MRWKSGLLSFIFKRNAGHAKKKIREIISVKQYDGLIALLDGLAYVAFEESVFVNLEQFHHDPIHAIYYIFPQHEVLKLDEDMIYDDESGNVVPVEFKNKNLSCWMEITLIATIVVELKKRNQDLYLSAIASALWHHTKYRVKKDADRFETRSV